MIKVFDIVLDYAVALHDRCVHCVDHRSPAMIQSSYVFARIGEAATCATVEMERCVWLLRFRLRRSLFACLWRWSPFDPLGSLSVLSFCPLTRASLLSL